MTPERYQQIKKVFLQAQSLDQAEREAYLDESCSSDTELRRLVDALFANEETATQFLESPAMGAGFKLDNEDSSAMDATLGSRPTISEKIEGYEILREIHRGAQGVVYKALQQATKRTVALKVLLQGPYASARQRHRFEREIDLVASLQHPNIVTVYDSGVTQGRHYFAMEYIHGQSLDVYLSDKNLSIDETLRLFEKTCSAVNYAHQRGVIHRDLKPGNIRIDANGDPHVLDFGLAKAAGPDLQSGSPVTVTGEFMGTLAYASPEQTKGDPNLIDIRTDVYSLGVILYEMLTGKYPYEVVGQMVEVLRNIGEAEPKKPFTIRRQINDEVETIVLKALAKERERRYQSAETLARDVEHYLNGEPIDAKRDSGLYVLRKQLKRYKLPVAIVTTFMLLVTGSAVGFLILWNHAAKQTKIAETKTEEVEKAREGEEEQRQVAERNASMSQAQATIFGALYDVVMQQNGMDLTFATIIRKSTSIFVDRLSSERDDYDPKAAAMACAQFQGLAVLARDYRGAELVSSLLVDILEEEFGELAPETLSALDVLAFCMEQQGQFERALPCLRRVLGGRIAKNGTDHPMTVFAHAHLAACLRDMGSLEEANSESARARTVYEARREEVENWIRNRGFSSGEMQFESEVWQIQDGDYAEAETSLLRKFHLYKMMKQPVDRILRRLVWLYVLWDKPSEASECAAKLRALSDTHESLRPSPAMTSQPSPKPTNRPAKAPTEVQESPSSIDI